MQYAMAGLAGHHMTVKNADTLLDFVVRLGIEFQVTTLRSAIARDHEIRKQPKIAQWITANAKELVAA